MVPNFTWRSHVNLDPSQDAVLYSVSDRALMQRMGQHRAQGRTEDGQLTALA